MSINELVEAIRNEELAEAGKKEAGYSVASVEDSRQRLLEVIVREGKSIEAYVENLEAEITALRARLESAVDTAAVTPVADVSSSVDMLATAERVAREHVEGAQEEAKNIIDAAYSDADSIIATRRGEYDQIQTQIVELSGSLEALQQNAISSILPLLQANTGASPSVVVTPEETPEANLPADEVVADEAVAEVADEAVAVNDEDSQENGE